MSIGSGLFDNAVTTALRNRADHTMSVGDLRAATRIRRGLYQHLEDMAVRGLVLYDPDDATEESQVVLGPSPVTA